MQENYKTLEHSFVAAEGSSILKNSVLIYMLLNKKYCTHIDARILSNKNGLCFCYNLN